MAGLSDVFSQISGWFKDVVNLLLALVLALFAVELIFGEVGGYSIVDNVQDLIEKFTEGGIVGLIALIVFAAIFARD